MKVRQDKFGITTTVSADDYKKAMEEDERQNIVLKVFSKRAPELYIDGEIHPVVNLSYQYFTDTLQPGTNTITADYIDGKSIKTIYIDVRNDTTVKGNEYHVS